MPDVSDDPSASPAAGMKKSDLLDQIAARSTLKKRDAKLALDAALALIGAALLRGEDLTLPPLGKLRVIRDKPLDNGAHLLTLKLRCQKDAAQSGKTTLATADDDD